MNKITTEKITRWVDDKQRAKVEQKAAGIEDVWQHGLENCDQTGSVEDVSRRAAVRAQQIVGCIPRVLDVPQRSKKPAAKDSLLPETAETVVEPVVVSEEPAVAAGEPGAE